MKTSPACDRVREALALGLPAAETREHLSSCAECRAEATALDRLVTLLTRTAVVTPAAALDRRARGRLGIDAPFAFPVAALGLAVAGTLALISALAIGFAASGAAESGAVLAAAGVLAYMALTAVVTVPLLWRGRECATAEAHA